MRSASQNGWRSGIPSRASALVELLELVGDHRVVEGAASTASLVCSVRPEHLLHAIRGSGATQAGVVCSKRERSRRARTPGAVRPRMRRRCVAEDRTQSVGPDEVAGDRASRIGVRALHACPEPVHRGEVEPLQREPRVVHSGLEPLVASVARQDSLAPVLCGIPGRGTRTRDSRGSSSARNVWRSSRAPRPEVRSGRRPRRP